MIVGSGLIASGLIDREVTLHAAGVANSACYSKPEFARDRDLLKRSLQRPGLFVYFGTSSSEYNHYTEHKQRMEELVRDRGNYLICKLPIVVGRSNNPHTLMNIIRSRILSGEPLPVWKKARRNIIDVQDVGKAVDWVVQRWSGNQTVLIAAPWEYAMPDVVTAMEKALKKKANRVVIDKGESPKVVGNIPIEWAGIESIIKRYYPCSQHSSTQGKTRSLPISQSQQQQSG